MIQNRWDLKLTKKQLLRRRKKTAQWIAAHPESVAKYDKKYARSRAIANGKRRVQYRIGVIRLLGGKCSSRNCRWINEDGTFGCTDFRLLQIDHKKGGGTRQREKHDFEWLCRRILQRKIKNVQLLCPNCNWLKAYNRKEFKFKYGSYRSLRNAS